MREKESRESDMSDILERETIKQRAAYKRGGIEMVDGSSLAEQAQPHLYPMLAEFAGFDYWGHAAV